MENHSNLATIWMFVCDSLILQFLRITVFRGTRAVTDANGHRQVAPERCFLSVRPHVLHRVSTSVYSNIM